MGRLEVDEKEVLAGESRTRNKYVIIESELPFHFIFHHKYYYAFLYITDDCVYRLQSVLTFTFLSRSKDLLLYVSPYYHYTTQSQMYTFLFSRVSVVRDDGAA